MNRRTPTNLSLLAFASLVLTTLSGSVVSGANFAGYVAYPTGSYPQAVAIADLNGDGRKDVVLTTTAYASNTNDNSILVFYQNGLGALNQPVRYAAGAGVVSVAIADFNGDGLLDIAAGKYTAGIRVFFQDAGGTFTNFTDYPTANAYKIAAGDFNNDGKTDIAGIGWSSGQVDLFTQGVGGLSFSTTYSASYSGYNDLTAGDVNGDGLTDIIVMDGQLYATPNISALLQTNGGFSAPVICDLGGSELTAGVGIGDVSGDGRNDIVVCYGGNRPASKIAVFNQAVPNSFTHGPILDSYDVPNCVVVADLDLDGLADVVTLHGGWQKAGVYTQYPAGVLNPEVLFNLPYASSYNPQGMAVGDVTGDGMPDVVIADYNNGLIVLRNTSPAPSAVRISWVQLNPNHRIVLTAPYLGGHGFCTVQRSDNLTSWTNVGTMTDSTWTDTDSTPSSKHFYRLLV